MTFTGANSFYVGEQVSLEQFATATYFNCLMLTITGRTATTDPGPASSQNQG